jgi:hypothetical protein
MSNSLVSIKNEVQLFSNLNEDLRNLIISETNYANFITKLSIFINTFDVELDPHIFEIFLTFNAQIPKSILYTGDYQVCLSDRKQYYHQTTKLFISTDNNKYNKNQLVTVDSAYNWKTIAPNPSSDEKKIEGIMLVFAKIRLLVEVKRR